MEEYFVKWKNPDTGKLELENFYTIESLFEWIDEHKGEDFAVYVAKCKLDWT